MSLNFEQSSVDNIIDKLNWLEDYNLSPEDIACIEWINACPDISPLQSRIDDKVRKLGKLNCAAWENSINSNKFFSEIEYSYNKSGIDWLKEGDQAVLSAYLASLAYNDFNESWKIVESDDYNDNRDHQDPFYKFVNDNFEYVTSIDDIDTWFQSYIMKEKKTWRTILWIRGTDDFTNDIAADAQLALSRIPTDQVLKLSKFINQNIKSSDQVTIVWHSLGWYLTQIADWMLYNEDLPENINAKTFHAPWAKSWININILNPIEFLDSDKRELESDSLYKNYVKYRSTNELHDRVTNYGTWEMIAPITNTWKDIWKNVDITWASLHSIEDMVNALVEEQI
jgi:hypothetical protein